MKSVYKRQGHQQEFNEEECEAYAHNKLLCSIQLGLGEKYKKNEDFQIPEADFTALQQLELQSGERDKEILLQTHSLTKMWAC